jgi:hypothetical protein
MAEGRDHARSTGSSASARAPGARHSIRGGWSHVAVAVHAVLLSCIVFLGIQHSYETSLFRWVVDRSTDESMNDEEKALALLHEIHQLLAPSSRFFKGRVQTTIRGRFLPAADMRLLEPRGCGSFSLVLLRALQTAGIASRYVQMKTGEQWGGHILVEAHVGDRWIALDPLFGLSFRRPDGLLASAEDVHGDWPWYSHQVPSRYPSAYDYGAIRYTNWDRWGWTRWIGYDLLPRVVGARRAREFSLRPHLSNLYLVRAAEVALLWVGFSLLCLIVPRWRGLAKRAESARGRGGADRSADSREPRVW